MATNELFAGDSLTIKCQSVCVYLLGLFADVGIITFVNDSCTNNRLNDSLYHHHVHKSIPLSTNSFLHGHNAIGQCCIKERFNKCQ